MSALTVEALRRYLNHFDDLLAGTYSDRAMLKFHDSTHGVLAQIYLPEVPFVPAWNTPPEAEVYMDIDTTVNTWDCGSVVAGTIDHVHFYDNDDHDVMELTVSDDPGSEADIILSSLVLASPDTLEITDGYMWATAAY